MIDQEITSRANTYYGRPEELQQRYAMSQNLVDLLALQKIKSEKEAAIRNMQLAQAAQTGKPPTTREKLEGQVFDMTRNEVAQQVGKTLQQENQEQQQALQKLLGQGIASAPGADSAAQPKMMAAGGIVAFDDGGRPEDKKKTDSEDKYKDLPPAYQMLFRAAKAAKEGVSAAREGITSGQAGEELRTFPQALGASVGAALPAGLQAIGAALGLIPRAPERTPEVTSTYPEEFERGTAAGGFSPAAVSATPPMAAAGPGAVGSRVAPPAGPVPHRVAPAAMPAAPAPQAAPATPAAPDQWSTFLAKQMNADPAAQRAAQAEWMQKMLAPSEEAQRKLNEQGIAALRANMPGPRTQSQQLADFLLGMGTYGKGRFGIAMGAGARHLNAEEEADRARKLEVEKQIFALQQKGLDLNRDNLKAVVTAGNAAYDKTMTDRMEAAKAGSTAQTHAERTAAEKDWRALDRASHEYIARLESAARRDATAATREATTESRRQALEAQITRYEQTALAENTKAYDRAVEKLRASFGVTGKPTPEQAKELELYAKRYDATRAEILKNYGNLRSTSGLDSGYKVLGEKSAK